MKKPKGGLLGNLVINRHTLWTIPNVIVFLRILLTPVFMTLLILGSQANPAVNDYKGWWVYLALGIMVFAAATDVIDGKIARHCKAGTKIGKFTFKHDQGTYIGQCIDPIADKVMHVGTLLGLVIAGYVHWAFLVLLLLRELCMIVVGSFIVNDVDIKANMLGKVASATISSGAILSFFHPLLVEHLWGVFPLDWIVLTVGLVLNWVAAVGYAIINFKAYRANKAKYLAEQEGNEGIEENTENKDEE